MKDFSKEYPTFEAALNLKAPWYVSNYELDQKNSYLHIYLDFHRGSTFICPHCGEPHAKAYDLVDEDRVWRHLDFWQFPTYLHARFPRVQCDHCGKIRTVSVDWARKGAGFTWFFESKVMSLMKEMPVNAVAREVGEHDTRLWRVFHYYVQKGMDACDISHVERIAIDETSSKRGHQYVTLFVDLETKHVLLAVEGKGAEGLRSFKEFLKEKGINPTQIKEVCCDMSQALSMVLRNIFQRHKLRLINFMS